jgi:hypothetical protein
MTSSSGRFGAVFIGEIYHHRQPRIELGQRAWRGIPLLIGRLGLPEIGSRRMCCRTVRQPDLLGNQCGGLGGRLAVMK